MDLEARIGFHTDIDDIGQKLSALGFVQQADNMWGTIEREEYDVHAQYLNSPQFAHFQNSGVIKELILTAEETPFNISKILEYFKHFHHLKPDIDYYSTRNLSEGIKDIVEEKTEPVERTHYFRIDGSWNLTDSDQYIRILEGPWASYGQMDITLAGADFRGPREDDDEILDPSGMDWLEVAEGSGVIKSDYTRGLEPEPTDVDNDEVDARIKGIKWDTIDWQKARETTHARVLYVLQVQDTYENQLVESGNGITNPRHVGQVYRVGPFAESTDMIKHLTRGDPTQVQQFMDTLINQNHVRAIEEVEKMRERPRQGFDPEEYRLDLYPLLVAIDQQAL